MKIRMANDMFPLIDKLKVAAPEEFAQIKESL
jgi:hypothetical protein